MEIKDSKAKKEFYKWYYDNYLKNGYCKEFDVEDFFKSVRPTFQNALMIEWLDSVGIFVEIEVMARNFFSFRIDHDAVFDCEGGFSDRGLATENAILTAIEIYKNKNNESAK